MLGTVGKTLGPAYLLLRQESRKYNEENQGYGITSAWFENLLLSFIGHSVGLGLIAEVFSSPSVYKVLNK